MFDFGTTQKLSDKSNDKLAKLVLDRFRSAVLWQEIERVGDVSLQTSFRRCYEQYHGLWAPEDKARVEKLKVDARVNLTAMKAGVVQGFLTETLLQPDSLPWAISPTPIPDLSDSARMEVLELVKEA